MGRIRFYKHKSTIEDYMIYDEDEKEAYFISCEDESNIDNLVELLNNLYEESRHWKRELQKELVCQAIVDGRREESDNSEDYKKLFNEKMRDKKYFKYNKNVKTFDIYGLITDSIYARLDVLFESMEFEEYLRNKWE